MDELTQKAAAVLKENDRGGYTVPSPKLYPHQWLWDSCFIAIGLRHLDARRAATEIESLFRGQWQNGMLPHITLREDSGYWAGAGFWQSRVSPSAPKDVATSGITQPPVVAIAAEQVAQKLPEAEAHVFLKQLFPKLLAHHNWLYRDRDPENSGLIVLVNAWECGFDNTPPWMHTIRLLSPLWLSTFIKMRLDGAFTKRRHDTKTVPPEQRITNIEALKLAHLAYLHRKNNYDSRKTIATSRYCVEDVGFNSILIAANKALVRIADEISEDIPSDLSYRFTQTEKALEELWDEDSGIYYSRNFSSKKLLKQPAISGLLPLFSGAISKERADKLVSTLADAKQFGTDFPIPTVPISSRYFKEICYWQGPSWINANWMVINGLRNYGYQDKAHEIQHKSLELVNKNGCNEYFSALTGQPLGASNFSWTAALTIDMINSKT